MNFAWPHLLWLLIGPAALLAREFLVRRGRESATHPKIIRAEAGAHSLDLADPGSLPSSRLGSRPRVWLCAGLALGIAALARPQWGTVDEPLVSQSREIILALDLSRSMLTQDVPPSRLERGKLLVQSLLERLAGERVGLVVFSGTSFLQSPLTSDYEIIREFLGTLGPDYMPVGGTNYGPMMDAAADAFGSGTSADRFLIVLSDGGANDDDWRDHIGKLKDKGIRVIGLGIGTAAGGFIPDKVGGFMKDERGAVVMAKLEDGTLRELANRTGGAYRTADQWVDLPGLLKATIEAGRKGRFVEKTTQRRIERFQWILAAALLCLLVSFWREFPVRPKPRDLRLKPRPAAALGALLIAFLAFNPARAEDAAPAPEPSAMLGRIVGRISAQDHAGALDWAELGQQTLTWGRQLQSSQQPVPPGPVRDALAAVNSGATLDPHAADWPTLRSNLEALLRKPEDQKNKDQQKQQSQQKDQQKDQQKQQQEQPKEQKQNQQQNQAQQKQDQQNQPQQGQGQKPADYHPFQPQQPPKSGQPKNSGEKPSREPPSGDTQRVGGTAGKKERDPARGDPSLAIPLQKLEQVRSQDSPAQLYQMIENHEPRPASTGNGKDW